MPRGSDEDAGEAHCSAVRAGGRHSRGTRSQRGVQLRRASAGAAQNDVSVGELPEWPEGWGGGSAAVSQRLEPEPNIDRYLRRGGRSSDGAVRGSVWPTEAPPTQLAEDEVDDRRFHSGHADTRWAVFSIPVQNDLLWFCFDIRLVLLQLLSQLI